MILWLPIREGFRSRLETIVRRPVSNHTDAPSNEQTQTRNSEETANETHEQSQPRNQGHVHGLFESTRDLESNPAVPSISWQEPTPQAGDWQEQIPEDERRDWQQSAEVEVNEWQEGNEEEMDGNWQETTTATWPQEIPRNDGGEDSRNQEAPVWHENDSQETIENWTDGPSLPPRARRPVPMRRTNRFHPPDDENVYSMELRELLSR